VEGSVLLVVPVTGAAERPVPVLRTPLDPYPGVDSPTATDAREIALTCIEMWTRGETTRPRVPGSAILEAIGAASRERPERILVVSDGLANGGALDLNVVGFDADPGAVAEQLDHAGLFEPNLDGMEILWTGLGESTTPLPQPVRTSLQATWDEILASAGATVTFDTRTGPLAGAAPAGPAAVLPEDGVHVPAVEPVTLPCGTRITVPAALLFEPDSTVLRPDADPGVFADIAGRLAAHPDWTATVTGHTADFGSVSGQRELSEQRASVVAAELVRLGATAEQIKTRGAGATEPAPPSSGPGGDSAARHRRVVIEVTRTGCAS
jgi:outer membrane protein OmpA-like peptidoglycan-associated protein